MNKAAHQPDELPRRDVLKGALRPPWDYQPSRTSKQMPPRRQRLPVLKAIRKENAKPGTRDWMLTNTYIDPDTWWRSPRRAPALTYGNPLRAIYERSNITRIPTLVSILLTIGWPRTPLFMRVGKHSRR